MVFIYFTFTLRSHKPILAYMDNIREKDAAVSYVICVRLLWYNFYEWLSCHRNFEKNPDSSSDWFHKKKYCQIIYSQQKRFLKQIIKRNQREI